VFKLVLALGLLFGSVASANAQTYPDRVVKIVIGVAPGGGIDVLVRGIAQELTGRWGKSVVVENRPGASALIAAEGVANAAPDGYTWLAVTDQIYLSNRFAFKHLPYNPETSFTSISLLARAEQFVLANAEVPANTLAELVAAEKRKPGSFAYGHWGDGSPPQLVYETLNKRTGTAFLGVPYKGVAPVLGALVGNEVQLSVGSSGVAGQLLQAKKVKALALAAKARSPAWPDVPTTAEAGFPEIQAFIWFGLAAPAGTPPALVERISAEVRDILRQPAFTERFVTSLGWKLVASTPAGMDETIRSELPIISEMIANAGVKPQ
jgi:tripartite-type tricarboxylate transporter receptor subunit TctC